MKTYEVFTEKYSKIYQANGIESVTRNHHKVSNDEIIAVTIADRPDLLSKIEQLYEPEGEYIEWEGHKYWYEYRLAKNRVDTCLATEDPKKYCNGFYLYSTKDPGNGKAFVVVRTNNPALEITLQQLEPEGEECSNCEETVSPCACMRNICIRCGKPVGNITFTVCDECWDKEHPPPQQPVSEEEIEKAIDEYDEDLSMGFQSHEQAYAHRQKARWKIIKRIAAFGKE